MAFGTDLDDSSSDEPTCSTDFGCLVKKLVKILKFRLELEIFRQFISTYKVFGQNEHL